MGNPGAIGYDVTYLVTYRAGGKKRKTRPVYVSRPMDRGSLNDHQRIEKYLAGLEKVPCEVTIISMERA